MSEDRNCGCGRSPTGLCIGWHSLEDEYKKLWKNGKNGKIKKINGVLNGTTC